MMIENQNFEGERSLFAIKNEEINNCTFANGESPLKESRNLKITNSTFAWKYPLWYSKDDVLENVTFSEDARSGVWYSSNLMFKNCLIKAPKTFRRVNDLKLENVKMPNALETLWMSKNVKINNVEARGDYFLMNSEEVFISNFSLEGNYLLDGGKNIHIEHSSLISKDAFWNCQNVYCKDCYIDGEYLAWNSENVTFENCKIRSLQGLCYVKNLKLINCQIVDSDLILEYSEVQGNVVLENVSIKNISAGTLSVKGSYSINLDENFVDVNKTKIEEK